MNAEKIDERVPGVAACIGEPVRARMLYCLLDGKARTSTELALIGGVSASTASVHLARLERYRLVKVLAQGRHRYYSLRDAEVANVLESLSVVAGSGRHFTPSTPDRLRASRTCYDHMAGACAVRLHDRILALRWLKAHDPTTDYELTERGAEGFARLGLDIAALTAMRRRFAYACLDWSERTPHLGGALAAGLLSVAIEKKWAVRAREGRLLTITAVGERQLRL